MDPCASVVSTCEWVCEHAASVSLHEPSLQLLADELVGKLGGGLPTWDEFEWHYNDDAAAGGPLTAQYVLVLDSLNWCFWPSATGMEYDTLASGLTRVLRADPAAFTPAALAGVTVDTLRSWFAPHDVPNASERVRVLHEVAAVLAARWEGSAWNLLRAAQNSGTRLRRLPPPPLPHICHTVIAARPVQLRSWCVCW